MVRSWLDAYVAQRDINGCSLEKKTQWPPLTPPYDPDLLENDPAVEKEYADSKINTIFNKHGLGFDRWGNEIQSSKQTKTRDNMQEESLNDTQMPISKSHDEL